MKNLWFVLLALGLAWPAESRGQTLWLDTIPAQSLACLAGSGPVNRELTDDDLAGLSKAAADSGLQTLGYPFVRSLARTGQSDQGKLAWQICAPSPAGTVVQGDLRLVLSPSAPGAFHFCPGDPGNIAKPCAEELLQWVDHEKSSDRLVRSIPILPGEEGEMKATVVRLLTDTAAIRVDSHGLVFPQEMDATPVDEQLQGKKKDQRPLFTTGRAFAPLAGGAISQRGVAVFVAITQAESDALAQTLTAPKP